MVCVLCDDKISGILVFFEKTGDSVNIVDVPRVFITGVIFFYLSFFFLRDNACFIKNFVYFVVGYTVDMLIVG